MISKPGRGSTWCRTSSNIFMPSASMFFEFSQQQNKNATTVILLYKNDPSFSMLSLKSFFQDGLKVAENLKPAMKKLSTDLLGVSLE